MKEVQRPLACRKELRAQRKADERNKDIERLKLATQNRPNARLFRLCPISALPEETLFEVATLDTSPTVLWLVCKRWRRVVQSCGSLWRFIKIEYSPHRRISVKWKYTLLRRVCPTISALEGQKISPSYPFGALLAHELRPTK
jgi:F-box-like